MGAVPFPYPHPLPPIEVGRGYGGGGQLHGYKWCRRAEAPFTQEETEAGTEGPAEVSTSCQDPLCAMPGSLFVKWGCQGLPKGG